MASEAFAARIACSWATASRRSSTAAGGSCAIVGLGAVAGVRLRDPPGRADGRRSRASACCGWGARRSRTAYQMDGAFNDVSLQLAHGASEPGGDRQRLDRAARTLRRPRGRSRAASSSRTSSCRARSTRCSGMGRIVPVVFLAVAAFLLNVVLTPARRRPAAADRRAQGARLLGCPVGWHFVKWALAVSATGEPWPHARRRADGPRDDGALHGLLSLPALHYRLPAGRRASSGWPSRIAAAVVGALGAVRRDVRGCRLPRPCGPRPLRRSA